jgi:glycosyltransferase involved in cell wall biosynthesis
MAVYTKDNPLFLEFSIISILNQSLITDDFIIVVDGPINLNLNKILLNYQNKFSFIRLFYLEKNMGLGNALNYGLNKSKNEIILRMDSDDISLPDRALKTLKFFNLNANVSVIGGNILEFGDKGFRLKEMPKKHHDIVKQLKFRNAINHPTVAFKKTHVNSVGSYLELKFNEDYFLWIRMVKSKFIFSNLDEVLLFMRFNENTIRRRRGLSYFFTQSSIYFYQYKNHLLNIYQLFFSLSYSFFIRVIVPLSFLNFLIKLSRNDD